MNEKRSYGGFPSNMMPNMMPNVMPSVMPSVQPMTTPYIPAQGCPQYCPPQVFPTQCGVPYNPCCPTGPFGF